MAAVHTAKSVIRAGGAGVLSRIGSGFAAVCLAGCMAFGSALAAPAATFASEASSPVPAVAAPTAAALSSSDLITLPEYVANECLKSVGSIYVWVEAGDMYGISQGSCVVISADGYMLTNYHVIEDGVKCVAIISGKTYDVEFVGSDPSSDVALLKVDPGEDGLVPIRIGSSADVRAGQWVMTVGAPGGEGETVSQGIVSNGSKRIAVVELGSGDAYYVGLIQTDAMINSGSSGGALVNANCELIGITTLTASTTGDFAGITYAIPIDYAMDIVDQILTTGKVSHPILGISVGDYHGMYYYDSLIWGYDDLVIGAYVSGVVEGSGAAEAGLQKGDVVTNVNGEPVYSSTELIIRIREFRVGDVVTLEVARGDKRFTTEVKLSSDSDALYAGDAAASTEEPAKTRPFGGIAEFLGLGSGDSGEPGGSTGSEDGGSGGYDWDEDFFGLGKLLGGIFGGSRSGS